jgi:uridine kinase
VSRAGALAEIAALPRDRTVFVGIDGFGAAGKSALASAAARAVPGSAVVPIDDFAAPQVPEWDWERFEAQVARPLLAGRPARYQQWGWNREEGGDWREIPPGRMVIVEGVSSIRREVRLPWALTVWVDAPPELRLRRVRERDGVAMLPQWLDSWLPSEHAYAAREDPMARVDLIVSGA